MHIENCFPKTMQYFYAIGSTGSGKSTVSNVLLGEDAFETSSRIGQCTLREQQKRCRHDDYFVMDMPAVSEDVLHRVRYHLHRHGGTVLYTYRHTRLSNYLFDHMRSLISVLGKECFKKCVVFVATAVPPEVLALQDDNKYQRWLRNNMVLVQEEAGVEFAAFLALSTSPCLDERHPAHRLSFMAELRTRVEDIRVAAGVVQVTSCSAM